MRSSSHDTATSISEIDDASAVLARFSNGSLATFEATRYARGHKALYTLEINGEKGSLSWDLHDLNRVQYFDHGVAGAQRAPDDHLAGNRDRVQDEREEETTVLEVYMHALGMLDGAALEQAADAMMAALRASLPAPAAVATPEAAAPGGVQIKLPGK